MTTDIKRAITEFAQRREEQIETLQAIHRQPNMGTLVYAMETLDNMTDLFIMVLHASGLDEEAHSVARELFHSSIDDIVNAVMHLAGGAAAEGDEALQKDLVRLLKQKAELRRQVMGDME